MVNKSVEAAKVLFLLAEVARTNFGRPAERKSAVTRAFCALAGKTKLSARDERMIERELAK
jgi:hypothetical protein